METKLKLHLIFFELEFNISKIIDELRVLLKFNFFLFPAMIATYAAAGYIVWNQLSANAERDVTETARLMLAGARAVRTYTTTQVAPLLDQEQAKVEHGVQTMQQVLDVQIPAALQKAAREERILQTAVHEIQDIARQGQSDLPDRQFFPQSIPFYAATEAFNYFRVQFPDFAYKEAALNPTNLRDRTADWESDIVNFFRDNPSKAEFAGRRDTPAGSSLYLSTPIRADSDSCLGCHGRVENAPPELVKLYGSGNGYGWRLNDVIGAQIVSVPADVARNRAAAAMKTVLIWLGGVFAGLHAIVNVIAFAFISRLVAKPAAP
jgi:Protein of unknown function (DUF3365)